MYMNTLVFSLLYNKIRGYKKGTNKNDSPANLLFTSVFEHAQYSSPVSRK